MKIAMVMVVSLNGKTTRGTRGNIYEWSSKEDKAYFFDLIDKNNLIIMGSQTYNNARKIIKITPNKLRVVLTKTPGKYLKRRVEGSLEFTSETPKRLIGKLSKKYKKALLVGGSKVNYSFFKAGLVDEVYLTLEPKIFGKGLGLVREGALDINLKLEGIKKMNKKGTVLLKYKVLK